MKHIITIFLLLLAILLPSKAIAYDFEVDGIYYNIHGETIEVTFGSEGGGPTASYTGDIVIPESVTYNGKTYPVTAIGNDEDGWGVSGAFDHCTALRSIVIPNSVTKIAVTAFLCCTGLRSITIPNSVTSIGCDAFKHCTALTDIEIPNSVIYIGSGAFDDTHWLDNQPDGLVYAGLVAYQYKGDLPSGTCISLNEGTLGIAGSAFKGCSGLANIDIPSSVISIGEDAFKDTQWYDNQPDGLVYAGLIAYKYKGTIPSNSSVSLKQGSLGIAEKAFYNQASLTNISIPNSVTHIEQLAFLGCSGLRSIEIPNSVVSIGYQAFRSGNLENISVSSDNSKYDSRNNCNAIIESSSNTLILGCKNTIIPNTVLSIGEYAFSGCSGLTSISIPNSVTAIGNWAFYRCSGLTSVNIPNSVTAIGSSAFSGCSGLTSVNIPNSVTAIGSWAFYGCSGLTRIEIGNSVTSIGNYAFSYCHAVVDLYCYATIPPECQEGPFSYNNSTLHIPAASLAAYFVAPYWSNFENIVGDAVVPTGISINTDSLKIHLENQFQLIGTVTPPNTSNNIIHWESTNSAVATVENGLVTAVGIGECDIIASCFGMQAVCHITVYQQISLDQQEVMLLPNHMLTLTPSATPFLPELTVSSSDPTVAAARVMNGKVQVVGIKEGTTTITVGSTDGTATPGTCFVTVYTESGDVNCDGFVNISDVISAINYLSNNDTTGINIVNADMNNDGTVTITDVIALINMIVGSND